MNILFSHPTGNANVRGALCGLNKAEMLYQFHTSIATFPGSLLDSIGGLPSLGELRRRRYNRELKSKTCTWPMVEAGRLISLRAGMKRFTRHETGLFCVDSVYKNIDKRVAGAISKVAKKDLAAIYAYEDAAESSFRAGKQCGLQCFYDLPIGYWRTAKRILQQESERNIEWAATLTGLQDSEFKLRRKDEELQLADRIFVASSFTAQTLQDFPTKLAPVEVIPYGFPDASLKRIYDYRGRRPLKLLFVGGLSQRKGIAEIFEVAEKLKNHIELTIVGHKSGQHCAALDKALSKHRWIPSLPHNKILALMQNQDVLLFPSLFEGFGLVITEAMSQGTPVITTNRTAGPDLIRSGENGWIIDAGVSQQLQDAIENILSNPSMVGENGAAAQETAQKRPWPVYGQELADAIEKHFSNTTP